MNSEQSQPEADSPLAEAIYLSVIFPVHNQEQYIETVVNNAVRVCRVDQRIGNFEVLIVNDGSYDRTGVLADSLANKYPEVRAIHHPRRRGYGAALKRGLFSSQKDWIAVFDSKQTLDFSDLDKFLGIAVAEDAPDLILGYRTEFCEPFIAMLVSKLLSFSGHMLFGLSMRDCFCGFKMLNKGVLEKIEEIEAEIVVEYELLVKAKKAGFDFGHVGIIQHPHPGRAKTRSRSASVLKTLREILIVLRHTL